MPPEDHSTAPAGSPDDARSVVSGMWQAPSVEELQPMLPQYEVLDLIGRGGMGVVYKARQVSVDRLVAIKVMTQGAAEDKLKFAERFKLEARAMARLSHPGIVAVHEAGETAKGRLYLVMEFVNGTDLGRLIEERGRIVPAEALRIAGAVCEALAFAHAHGVVHRDIKPANVMLDSAGHVKVADFGLAKMTARGTTTALTQSNVMMGSPDFVAPEGLKRGGVLDHRADVFAVGVMLYQMLTGELPRGMFKIPSRLVPGLDERFDAIVCKAMEPEPTDRHPSAQALLAELEVLRSPQPSKKLRAGAWMLMSAAALLLVVAAGVVWMRTNDSPVAGKTSAADEAPWHPVFDSAEDFAGKRAEFKDGWAVLSTRPLTIGRDVRDGAVRATTRYSKSGVGSLTVRANQNGHQPVIAFISGGGRTVVLEFRPDYSKKETQRRDFELPKPLAEGEEFTMELSARGPEFRVSINGTEVGRALRDLPGITSGTMGVVPVTGQSVQFKNIAWREFPATAP